MSMTYTELFKANKMDHMTKASPCARVIVNACSDSRVEAITGSRYSQLSVSAFCSRYESVTPISLKAFCVHL